MPLVSNSLFKIFVFGLQHLGAIYKDTIILDFNLDIGQFIIKGRKRNIILDDFLPINIELSLSNF